MTPSRYIVIQCGGAWAISGPLARFPPMFTRSTPRSISPEKRAKLAAPPLMRRTMRTVWTYERDQYPSTPGNPANGRAHGTYRSP